MFPVSSSKDKNFSNKGIYIALLVILCWAAFLSFALNFPTTIFNPWNILIILILTHLYTGLFITAHDAMHGTVSSSAKVNNLLGNLCVILFACFSYKKLKEKHHSHHRHVTSEEDPDYHEANFFVWFAKFMIRYMNVWQLIILAALYNLIHIFFGIPKINLILFWIIPPVLSSLQLFYFGTYLPHKNPEEISNKYKSRTQNINFFLGFISCYFFGYHYEHHAKPYIPWWRLWREKNV
ncbi:MAG TPA: fatty acid desaturase [Cytophagaceae bacterium]|jgi:beta-carotene ketolase (CrtW type)|nr:fatty acid desaturase [Cytophagaceae bacterium]